MIKFKFNLICLNTKPGALKNVKRILERKNIEQIRHLFGKKWSFGIFQRIIEIE
jgi:hypothetical protein